MSYLRYMRCLRCDSNLEPTDFSRTELLRNADYCFLSKVAMIFVAFHLTLSQRAMLSTSAALATAKAVYGIAKIYENAELMDRLNTLITQLTDANIENMELSRQLRDQDADLHSLREEVARLQKTKDAELVLAQGVYWKGKGRKKGTEDGPFCSACYLTNSRAIPLAFQMQNLWRCPICKAISEVR